MRNHKPLTYLAYALPSLLMFALAWLIYRGHESRALSALFIVAIGVALLVEEVARCKYTVKGKKRRDDRT